MRDPRDPTKLGEEYLKVRSEGVSIDVAVRLSTPPYQDGGHISSDPAQHHSKTPQNLGDMNDGGTP